MADYDFASLSPVEFETLIRDLLQAEHGRPYESFKSGPDGGIDLRHIDDAGARTIVQCKHYSSFRELLRAARREVPKVRMLHPERYILATSTPLSHRNKSELSDVLSPFVLSPGDVLSRGDVNGLLARHAHVEARHFKLWLSSLTVLQNLTSHGVAEDTELALRGIRRRMRKYVPNPSFFRAREVLESLHYCVIAGIPGIGKSTLSELLLIEYVDRLGYDAIRISSDIGEIRGVRNPARKLIFFYDDFLGKTTLDKTAKNEDQRLVEFIAEVAQQPNWRFVMATREYILNRARESYETLTDHRIDLAKCVISLADYTPAIRAQILYNHIYFAEAPIQHRSALLERSAYRKIIHHHNYNPRVIEHMLERYDHAVASPDTFVHEFMQSLDNPELVWDHAFRHQLSDAARSMLLTLVTFPSEALLVDVEAAFAEVHRDLSNVSKAALHFEFVRALKELDGNFVRTRRRGEHVLVAFHNPSLEDYIEQLLASENVTLHLLVRQAVFFEQLRSLAFTAKQRQWDMTPSLRDEFYASTLRTLEGPSCDLRYRRHADDVEDVVHDQPQLEDRIDSFMRMEHAFPIAAYNEQMSHQFRRIVNRIATGVAQAHSLIRIVNNTPARIMTMPEWSPLLDGTVTLILENIETIDDIRSITSFGEPTELLDSDRLAHLKSCFVTVASDAVDEVRLSSDLDEISSVLSDIEDIGKALDVPVKKLVKPLVYRMADIEADREDRNEPSGTIVPKPSPDEDLDEIDGMFANLLNALSTSAEP